MTRIGVISDIHGDFTAFRAVLNDAGEQGVEEYWLLGDTLMPGAGAHDLLDAIAAINTTACVLGNWDAFFLDVMHGKVDMDDPTDVYAARLSQYVFETIGEEGYARVSQWPVWQTRTVNGIIVSLSHNLPTCNEGNSLQPWAPAENFDAIFENNPADFAVIGHTHTQMLRYDTAGRRVINPGSVGQPLGKLDGDRRAQYAVLDIDGHGLVRVDFRKVDFDRDAEAEYAREHGLPYCDLYCEQLMTGINITHDAAELDEVSNRLGYKDDVVRFLASR